MATNLPFTPTTGATAGNTVAVTATGSSVNSTINCATAQANNIRVFNSSTVAVFVRMSREAAPAATAGDVPVGPGQSIVMMNPNPEGVTGVAILPISATASTVYFTPGEGGS